MFTPSRRSRGGGVRWVEPGRRRPGSTHRTPPRERREEVNIGRWRRRRGNYCESRNPKNVALQRSAASIGGKWPEPSNGSISTRPPASR